MLSLRATHWCGAAAMLSGAMLVVKGIVMIVDGYDLDALPFAIPLFALGLVGLHGRLRGQRTRAGHFGGLLARIAVMTTAGGLVAGGFVALREVAGVTVIPYAVWPIHVILLVSAFPLTLVAALLLGFASVRSQSLPDRSAAVMVIAGALWLPLLIVGETLGDVLSPNREIGLGFLPAGFAWIGLGYVVRQHQSRLSMQPLVSEAVLPADLAS